MTTALTGDSSAPKSTGQDAAGSSRPSARGASGVADAAPSARRRGIAALWAGLAPDRRIALLAAALAPLAAGVFAGVVVHLPAPEAPFHLPWWAWVAAFALGESLVVHVQIRRESHTFSMTDVVVVAALCLAHPTTFVTAQLTGAGLVLLLDRRQSALKATFNLVQFALTYSVAATAFAVVADGAEWSDLRIWLAAVVTLMVSTLISNLSVFTAIWWSEGVVHVRDLRRVVAQALPFVLGTGVIGLLIVRTAVLDPWGLILLAAPTALTIAACRAYTHARRQEEKMRLLHEVTSLLYDGDDAHDGLAGFVTAVRNAFRAAGADLVLYGDDSGTATVTRSREGHDATALLPLDEGDDVGLLLRSAVTGRATTSRTRSGSDGSPLGDYVRRRGLKDAMVAVLRTEGRLHGLLLVVNRLGEVSTFTESDQRLLETFARHVATAVERGRLQDHLRTVTDLQEKLRHQALHDALTGLPNRTLFLDRAENAIRLACRTEMWPAVLYLDLDGFKPVNDTYGHEAGDLLLQAFADRLRGCLRSADTAARLGGDEFAVLVNGPIDLDGVTRVVGRIKAELRSPIDLGDGRRATIGASIGVAIAQTDAADVEVLMRRADQAMYAAKRARDGRSVLYSGELETGGPITPIDCA